MSKPQESPFKLLQMLRYILLGCVALLFVNTGADGQTQKKEFELVDRFCSCPEFRWNGNSYVLNDIQNSSHETEIRYKNTVPNGYESITVLTRDGGKTKGTYYHRLYNGRLFADSIEKYGKWEQYPYRKFEIENIDLDSVVAELTKHRVFSLTDQKEVSKKPFMGSLVIEFKTKGKTGKYRFGPSVTVMSKSEQAIIADYTAIGNIFNQITKPYREISINTVYSTQPK